MASAAAGARGLALSAGGRLGAGVGGGVALVLAGVVEGLAIADGFAVTVLGRPLLGHACQLRIVADRQRVGGENIAALIPGAVECHGADQIRIIQYLDVDIPVAICVVDIGNIVQAIQARQPGPLDDQSPRQSATQFREPL